MPAIQPVRLTRQIDELVTQFEHPLDFSSELHGLLNFYADRTLRSSQIIEAAPLLNSYRIMPPVMRQIEKSLQPRIMAAPEQALSLADYLWAERWLESRMLAITILGELPSGFANQIIQRITLWGEECREDKVLRALVSTGLQCVRLTAFVQYLSLIEGWLGSSNPLRVHLGIRSLPALLEMEIFENLPLVFRWLAPLVREINLEYKDDLIRILRILISRSPQETAYFLRQALNVAANPQTGAVIRRVLDDFPKNIKLPLQEALRAARNNRA